MKELIAAAEAVIEEAQAMGTYIHALRNAVDAVRAKTDDTLLAELNFATGALERQSERIALLEGLLRQAEADIYWANVVLKERIRAALGEG